MKNLIISTLLLSIILFSCDETNTTTCTFTRESVKSATVDSLEFNIETVGDPFRLKGNLEVSVGECDLLLKVFSRDTSVCVDTTYINDTIFSISKITGTDTIYAVDSVYIADTNYVMKTRHLYDTIFKHTVKADNTYSMDQRFNRRLGKWVFYAKSKKIGEDLPDVNFDFNFTYNN